MHIDDINTDELYDVKEQAMGFYYDAKEKRYIRVRRTVHSKLMQEDFYGNRAWLFKGELHREDGPAIESANGDKAWWINDKRHRVDGPAVEYFDGSKLWYINGLRHRIDGPAMEFADGYKCWYIDGKELTLMEFINHDLVSDETIAEVLTKWV